MKVKISCTMCGNEYIFPVDPDGYHNWIHGTLIQEALPDNTDDERELLISNTCGDCFDSLFSDEFQERIQNDYIFPEDAF